MWTQSSVNYFHEKSWRNLMPVLLPLTYNWDLNRSIIYPVIKVGTEPKVGPFGSACMDTVHQEHQRYVSMNNVDTKEIIVTRENEQNGTHYAWNIDPRAMVSVRKLNHLHTSEFSAAIRRGDNCNFMSPRAKGDSLRDYWQTQKTQIRTAERIFESVYQLRGIAAALDSLHGYHNTPLQFHERGDRPKEEAQKSPQLPVVRVRDEDDSTFDRVSQVNPRSIRHGDLKPENILRFLDTEKQGGFMTLKIADCGRAKIHTKPTQNGNKHTNTRHDTIPYDVPEAANTMSGSRLRLYDIWSTGCMTLEFMIWALYGKDELEAFYSQIRDDPNQIQRYFKFTNLAEYRRTGVRLVVHPLVHKWMKQIQKNDPYTTPPLKDWKFMVDNDFAEDLLKDGHTGFPLPSVPHGKFCDRCSHIDFWEEGFMLKDSMESLSGRAEQCDFCRLLSTCGTEELKGGLVQLERKGSNLMHTSNPFPVLSVFRSPDLRTPTPIQIGLPEFREPNSDAFFRILKHWLRDCDRQHKYCHGDTNEALPTRLIDVGTEERAELRLIETREEDIATKEYIALSHPWGDTSKYKAFSTLRKDPSGAGHELHLFKPSIPPEQLPATFRDAVFSTRKLGVRYLWIDSICIVQGEDGDFTEEVNKMEDVFSGAYCVLAASRATSQHDGLLGPRPQREYVTFQRGAEKPFYACKMIDNFNKDVLLGSLNKRGWVLQERALARRTIFFTENQTYFECGNGIRCETLTKMRNNLADFLGDARFPQKAMRAESGALKIAYFQDLYILYSRLQFTKYEDRPFAIAGLEKRLQRAFDTKGGYGIFSDGDISEGGLFHRSLLWRRGKDEPRLYLIDFPSERGVQVPSWSWMAYKGGIDYTDPPYLSAIWEKEEIQSPWIPHTANQTDSSEKALIATVRDFAVPRRKEQGVNLTYDNPEQKTGLAGHRAQCVVLAKSAGAGSDRERVCYVLLVVCIGETASGEEKKYKRIGAGTMLGKFIVLSTPGIPAKIY